jgi:outer membrane beta-barrel protein
VRNASVLFTLLLTTANARAAGPQYVDDPFGDNDFEDAPLILDTAYPSRGRGELSLLFASTVIDKYTTHIGGVLQLDYNITQSFGAALSVGFLHGKLTNIVTDDAGIIGNKMSGQSGCIQNPANCVNINPNVPDYDQLTGVIDAMAVWSPLYGKMNVVSEIDGNMQAYLLLGLGAHGTRRVNATAKANPVRASDYTLSGGGFGEGGFLSDPKVHATVGVGLQLFFLNFIALRGEARGFIYPDKFDFGSGEETIVSQYWFFHAGLGFILF